MYLIRVHFSFEKLRSRYKFIFFYLGREKFVYYYCCTDSFSPLILCLRVKPNPRLGSLTPWISSPSKQSKTRQVACYPAQNIPTWTPKIHGSAANPGLKKSLKLDVNGFLSPLSSFPSAHNVWLKNTSNYWDGFCELCEGFFKSEKCKHTDKPLKWATWLDLDIFVWLCG